MTDQPTDKTDTDGQSPSLERLHPYDWAATVLNILSYVLFMVFVYVSPAGWTEEIISGSGLTVSLFGGICVILLLIVTSIWHTVWANTSEAR